MLKVIFEYKNDKTLELLLHLALGRIAIAWIMLSYTLLCEATSLITLLEIKFY